MIPNRWAIVGFIVLALILGVVVQTHRLHSAQASLTSERAASALFREETRQLGEAAAKKAAEQTAADKKAKEVADAENTKVRRDLAGLYDAYGKLRDSRANAGSSFLPATAPGSNSPPRADFDRATLDRALSGFDRGVTGLLGEGDAAITDLNTAKAWAAK